MLMTVNTGSSSLKLALFDASGTERVFDAAVQEIGGASLLKHDGRTQALVAEDHSAALAALIAAMGDRGLPIEAVAIAGHRVVHGGERFSAPAELDAAALAAIDALAPLAPLHNPPAAAAIRALAERRPDLRQIGFFDTAFHAGQPAVATAYALPARLREAGCRRYGFHGLSYQGLVEALRARPEGLPKRVLALHLGNGASLCAILDGVSVATTMGFSPLEGLTMGTRSGSVDPALALRIAREFGVDEAERLLTEESGLKALSGGVSDMRALLAAETPAAAFAVDHFCYWAARHAGSMIAAMGGVDLLAFTGGIGENAPPVREKIETLLCWTGAAATVVAADEERVVATGLRRILEEERA